MNRKAKVEKGVFGAAPEIDASLPTIKGVSDDGVVAAAIGRIGGGVQRLICSTAFYFGAMSKAKKVKGYTYNTAWEEYYTEYYAANPLQPEAKRKAKANCVIYAKVARLPWDSQSYAGQMFDHPHGSQSQKTAALNKLIEDYGSKAPTAEEFAKLLPGPKAKGGGPTETTIKAWAAGKAKAFADVRDDENLWGQIESNATLLARFEAASEKVDLFNAMAATITDKAKADAKLAAKLAGKPGKTPAAKVPAAMLKGGRRPKDATVQ